MHNKIKSIAIFVPHLGCPHICTFCDQHAISHTSALPTQEYIESAVKTALLSNCPQNLEIAYFGGSFTCIDRTLMCRYLDIAQKLVDEYGLYGIRFSTRPDGIDSGIMQILSKYSVKTIELGAQSMNDEVLAASERGHTAADTLTACKLIEDAGYALVLQMMTGMPESSFEDTLRTCDIIIAQKPQAVRIYPMLVLKNTTLENQFKCGEYVPQSIDDAVTICATLYERFKNAGIPIIKLGLQAEDDFENGTKLVAGPYHPAFRELVEGKLFLKMIEERVDFSKKKVCVFTNKSELSKVKGHKSVNAKILRDKYPQTEFAFDTSVNVEKGNIIINYL